MRNNIDLYTHFRIRVFGAMQLFGAEKHTKTSKLLQWLLLKYAGRMLEFAVITNEDHANWLSPELQSG